MQLKSHGTCYAYHTGSGLCFINRSVKKCKTFGFITTLRSRDNACHEKTFSLGSLDKK